ncbi:siRNA Hypothetical protein [Nesidiocoris tenuis]|uniref:DRBM domain-containing protein n=1 Tax=Nesidiocoris tenuis TaxID=355587 RepID=A0ABN7B002_9HEMI|nr:siRNA Hypothetical protein [Nesidiocoris tenuis]
MWGRFNTRSSAQQNANQGQAQNQNYSTGRSGYNTRNSYTTGAAYVTPSPTQQQAAQQYQQPELPPKVEPVTPSKPVEVKGILKNTPQQLAEPKPEAQPEDDSKMESSLDDDLDEDGKKKKKHWKKRSPDFKLPRRIRKRRQNARLKSLLAPKNALMVLHELHPELKMLVSEQVSNTNQMSYIVDIEIDGQSFRGIGMSKNAAKQAASESALKAVLLKKIEESNSGAAAAPIKSESADEEMPLADAAKSAEGESADGATNGDQPKTRAPPEDDVPWGSLASFALYKLFSEWQSQGFQLSSVTGLHHMTGVAKPPPAPTPMKKLPEDAHTKHPVQLLNQLYPGCLYHENREGAPPKMTFTFSVVVNDQTFKGVGSNKKEAKKECAKHALQALGVVYPSEPTPTA